MTVLTYNPLRIPKSLHVIRGKESSYLIAECQIINLEGIRDNHHFATMTETVDSSKNHNW